MAFEFVPIQASEQQDLTEFLVKSFRAAPNLISFRPEVLHWKYFAEHPEWTDPRSLAIKEEGRIVAHAGIWPLKLVTHNSELRAIHLIDWAANRAAIGAGAHLLKKVAGEADVLLAIGGSQDTRNLLPKLGYKRFGELRRFSRVIRPWLQLRTTPHKDWKTPIKFLRNSALALLGIPPAPKGWSASKLSSFVGAFGNWRNVANPTTSCTSSRRSAAELDYLLSCPAAQFSGFQVSQEGRVRGYFLLTQVGRQARIVDVQIDGEDRESWKSICALAARAAAEDQETCEIVAASSIPVSSEAWLQMGFARRRIDPILCLDPRNLLTPSTRLNLHLTDNDFCILIEPSTPYLS
jgi:hypothetical protein